MTNINSIQHLVSAQNKGNNLHEEVRDAHNILSNKRAMIVHKNEKTLSIHEKDVNQLNRNELIVNDAVKSTTKISSVYKERVDNLHSLQEV
jgi:hypothetical protein